MSNRALEDRLEHEQTKDVAVAIGITVAELKTLDWSIEAHESDDGMLYGYNVYFAEGSNPKILNKIDGLNDGRWIRIGPIF